MQWFHEPARWRTEDGALLATADPKTDFWRKTHDGGVRDNGHHYFERVSGPFVANVRILGRYASQYDQAGLMVRASDSVWLKCGVEFVDGEQLASAVVTRDWSDWSVVTLARPESIWMRIEREEATITVSYSLDGRDFTLLRQAFLTEQPDLDVGPFLAAPRGDGFEARFTEWSIARD